MLYTGICLEFVFMVLTLLEIVSSKKALNPSKIMWSIYYGVLPVLAFILLPVLFLDLFVLLGGTFYLRRGRRIFIPTRKDFDGISFDSF